MEFTVTNEVTLNPRWAHSFFTLFTSLGFQSPLTYAYSITLSSRITALQQIYISSIVKSPQQTQERIRDDRCIQGTCDFQRDSSVKFLVERTNINLNLEVANISRNEYLKKL